MSSQMSSPSTLHLSDNQGSKLVYDAHHPTHNSVPSGWDMYIHPQGWVYFTNPVAKVVTDEDVRIPSVLQDVEKYTATFPLSELDEHMEILVPHGALPHKHILTLVVNHLHCIASYTIDQAKIDNFSQWERYMVNKQHRLYWNYLSSHPAHVPTPVIAEAQVRDALTWYHVDNLNTGARSVVPFSKHECEDLLRILNDARGEVILPKYQKMIVSTNQVLLQRRLFLVQSFYHGSLEKTVWTLHPIDILLIHTYRGAGSFRDAERYGRYTRRQSNDLRAARKRPGPESVPAPPIYIRLPLDFVVYFFFFGIPSTYLAHVKGASEYHGRLSNVQLRWERYIDRIVQEYQDFLLIATVLLSANVSFLAIGDIGATGQAAGVVSVFASLGSIIIGVFCVWKHQANRHQSRSFAYLHNAHHGIFGLQGHALTLSLPPVLLVWAVIAFTVAFLAYTIDGTYNPSKLGQAAAWATLGVSLVVLLFIGVGLYTFARIWNWRSRWRM